MGPKRLKIGQIAASYTRPIGNLILQSDTGAVKEAPRPKRSKSPQPASDGVKAPVPNLLRYKTSGTYFARVRIRGKLFRHALKTNVISVAKLRLSVFIKGKREDRN